MVEGEQRRRSPRLRCAGSAQIVLSMSESPMEAAIADLSIGGCLLNLERPALLHAGRVIELAFIVNQFPFRVRALVCSVRSPVKIGFTFIELSARSQQRLEDLLDELKEVKAKLAQSSRSNSAGVKAG